MRVEGLIKEPWQVDRRWVTPWKAFWHAVFILRILAKRVLKLSLEQFNQKQNGSSSGCDQTVHVRCDSFLCPETLVGKSLTSD